MSIVINNKPNGVNLIDHTNFTNNNEIIQSTNDDYIDIKGRLVVDPSQSEKTYFVGFNTTKTLDECKENCSANKTCLWLEYGKNECHMYQYDNDPNGGILQWSFANYTLPGCFIGDTASLKEERMTTDEKECHEKCIESSECLYSIFNGIGKICYLMPSIINYEYTLSISKDYEKKLKEFKDNIQNKQSYDQVPEENESQPYDGKSEGDGCLNVLALYSLTIVILIVVAIILCIFKRRSDKEKILLYTLSNASNSRSRSKSSPSENMSYLNSGSYLTSGSYFGNTFNASSITINPDTLDSQKHSRSSHSKKSRRKSTGSKAPSVHSISTLCTSNSTPNKNEGDTTQNEKHNLSLSTKKSSYNYSIKTFSAKDPSLTGLSQNIKTLFANSYSGNNDSNTYYDTFSTLSTGSPKIEAPYDSVLYKDSISSNSIKNIYGQHKKQNSSISITIPKISNNTSVNVSPKNNLNGNGVVAVNSPQQPKLIKIKKPVHTKQFSVSRSVYSEPVLPMNTTSSEISLHDDLDGISYIEPQDQISFNANSTLPSVAIVNATKVK